MNSRTIVATIFLSCAVFLVKAGDQQMPDKVFHLSMVYLKANPQIATFFPSVSGIIGSNNFGSLSEKKQADLSMKSIRLEAALKAGKAPAEVAQLGKEFIGAAESCISCDYELMQIGFANELEHYSARYREKMSSERSIDQ